jgi:hypothetical protein
MLPLSYRVYLSSPNMRLKLKMVCYVKVQNFARGRQSFKHNS